MTAINWPGSPAHKRREIEQREADAAELVRLRAEVERLRAELGADSSARDRALKLVQDELGQCAAVGATQDDTAYWIVNRLIQYPEVLRALAEAAAG